MARLADAFRRRCEAASAELVSTHGLEAILERHCGTAERTSPMLRVDPVRFATHLAGRMDPDVDVRRALDEVHAADVYFALACGIGDRRAVLYLASLLESVGGSLEHLTGASAVDDVIQALRTKLLVSTKGSAPKILEYAGRGPFAGWLRVAAIRTAVSIGRSTRAAATASIGCDALASLPAFADDPELTHLLERLALSESELESLIGIMSSTIELSVERLLEAR